MRNWLAKSIEFSGMSQADIARGLTRAYPGDWPSVRGAENKLTKMLGEQRIKAQQMVQISEVTGYPMPIDENGTVDWRIMLKKSLSAARKLGALDSELLSIALAEVPVAIVPAADRDFFARLDEELALLANKDEILEAASEGFSQLLVQPRKSAL